jgi:DNA-binding protein HU-beta
VIVPIVKTQLLRKRNEKVVSITKRKYMKKSDLVEAVMTAAGLETKKSAETAVDAVFETIIKTVSRGEEVAIAGFGTFRASKRAARTGINPKTGEKIQIAAKTAPKFRAGKVFKDSVA